MTVRCLEFPSLSEGMDGEFVIFGGTWESRSQYAKFSEEEWKESHLKSYFKLMVIMKDAKVKDIQGLVGKPVEITFDSKNALYSWRVLTEVL